MEKLVLPKFNGEDFAVWRFQIESYLAVYDLLEVVDGTLKRPLEAARQSEWDKLDWKARLIIGNALEMNVVRQIMNLKTANEIRTRLSSLYELRDDCPFATATILRLPNRRRNDHRRSANKSVTASTQKEEALKASMSEMSLENKTPAALLHKKSCDKKVKPKKGDVKQKVTQKPKKFNGACFCCGTTGHRKSECQKSETAAEEASAITDKNELLMAKIDSVDSVTDTWFADTGALHHMSPRRELFRNFVENNDNSVAITVGSKEVVYAKGRGMIDADFDFDGYTKRTDL
ncbi:uncharacterized protein LOC112457617, partial [Temnothorax curvispinosus]|uniref:Uncharacterized protein LOC112457617 n=1 Tax=Temnothorax curvispinosus TaxID=300111 RepID=A0A6J1Q2Z6_9HYME